MARPFKEGSATNLADRVHSLRPATGADLCERAQKEILGPARAASGPGMEKVPHADLQ